MVQKLTGFYGGSQAYTHFNKDNLFIEVSNYHYCCWVRTEKNNSIAALEIFTIDEQLGFDWNDIFYEIGKQSVLTDKSYNLVTIFYNTNENVLVPAYKFNAANADGYLDLMFGTNENTVIKYDSIDFGGEAMYNVYRINAMLSTMIKSNFLTITEFHTYTGLLKHLTVDSDKTQGNAINLYFYNKMFIAIVLKNNKLQIAQRFIYSTPEDVLYYALNFTNVYKLTKDADPLFVSGMVDQNGSVLNLLKQHFSSVYIAYPNTNEVAFESNAEFPIHYFTPFFNLQV
jgi:hypothetical protein